MDVKEKRLYRSIRQYLGSLPKDLIGKSFKVPDHGFTDYILPFDLYKNTRQNVERIADQINKSFYFGIYDGCAVLMRRLIEMLLISAFQEHGIKQEILDSDGFFLPLSAIVKIALGNTELNLTRNARENLGLFVEKGNLSAHNPFYNARKRDIEIAQSKFRQLVEELFYTAKILK